MRFPDEEFIQAVTFTPNGDRALAIGGDAIHVVDAVGARELRRISMDGARPLQTMAVSPRGRWLAVGTSRTPPALSDRTEAAATVFAWPLSGDGIPRSLWADGDMSIPALAFSPDEARIGSIGLVEHRSRGGPMFDGDIALLDLATAVQQTLTFETDEVRQGRYDVIPRAAAKELAFTHDGSTIVAGMLGLRAFHSDSDRESESFPQLVLYDATTLQRRRTVDLGGADFTALATNADGSLLATGHDRNTVRLWTTATARQRAFFLWPAVDRRDVLGSALYGGGITGLVFHPDGRRLAVARHDGVAVVDVVRGTRQEIAAARDQGYSAVAFSPDGASLLYASGTVQNTGFIEARVSQWVTATGKQGWTFELGTTEVPRLAFAPNGKWFAAATSGGVSIHDATTGLRLATLAILGTDDWLVWTPDGRYAGSPAGIARLGAVRQGRRAVPIAAVGRKLELPDLLAQVLP
ncbi:MAG TPA: WD40 repeat domain-containing protein [Vicinamibacterales bacterium]|jgi:WD40 repeat protein|nr:WD40 repeat domain-containing protein [Vicinamibacterales bacterium]